MRIRLFFAALFLICFVNTSYSQLTGGNDFLQGHWAEIGIAPNGSWGPGPAPAGYHPYTGWTNLAMVYDYGHDGWTVGNPPLYGDFVYPGTPFEGWSIQVNGARSDAFYTSGGTFTYTGTLYDNTNAAVSALAGSNNVSYTNTGGTITGVWQYTTTGSSGGLKIIQSSRLDTNASWVVVTTKFINTTAAALPGVYYWRTCDPDDDETFTGNYATNNTINYQNDADHRVMVSSTGTSSSDAYLALSTKDCRAKAMIYELWSPTPAVAAGNTLDQVYNQSAGWLGTTYYGLGNATLNQDIAFGLIYNIGTIAAGDSAVISYAYTFNNNAGIDSAFPEPALVVNGVSAPPSGPAPAPTFDTFNVCHTGITSLPINLNFASDKNWTWSSWSWSPGTGLSGTTGTSNSITTTSLPPIITYTITGTDSNVNMHSCNTRTFYLTILTCNGAIVNNPCLGDSLKFNAPGDSTAATYVWYGPAPSTTVVSTSQSFTIYPSVWADTGTYYVVKTVGGVHDTSSTIAVINPNPIVTASSNSPLCTGLVDTLFLTSASSVTPVTYSWSGPASFASTAQNPSIPGFTAGNVGPYTVTATSSHGCKGSATTTVALLPPPGPPTVTDRDYCQGTPFVPFSITGVTGTVIWYTSATGAGATVTTPTVNTSVVGTYTFYYNQTVGRCASDTSSITVTVNPSITVSGTDIIHRGCNSDMVTFTGAANGAPPYTYLWNFADGTTSTDSSTVHTYALQGTYTATLTATSNAGCSADQTFPIDTRHDVIAAFTNSKDTFCAYNVMYTDTITNNSYSTIDLTYGVPAISSVSPVVTYAWDFGDGTTSTAFNPQKTYPIPGIYPIRLTVTDSIGCQKITIDTIVSLGVGITSFHDTTLCLRSPLPLKNVVTLYPNPPYISNNFTYLWTESLPPNLDNDNIQTPSLSGYGVFTDTLTATINPWGCYARDTITVHSVMGNVLTNVTNDVVIPYGSSVQLNADNEVIYRWTPNDGSIDNPNINNPNVTPLETTIYEVFGYDQYGCMDTAFVTVTVDSTIHEFIPSAFTPNGDGLNDIFRPVGISYQRLVEFRIFNRWGQQVFYSNDVKKGWDGTFNGVPQDMGVYNYIIIVAHPGSENHEGQNVVYKGDVTLIR